MHNPESIQENEMHKIHQDFELMTDPLILARRPDPVIINWKRKKKKKEENSSNSGLCHPGRQQSENQRKQKRDKYLDLARELKKAMEYEGDGDTNCKWCARNNPQKLGKRIGRVEKSKDKQIPSKLQHS